MNRSRACILPTPGDPFLLQYWLDMYSKYWAHTIDKLYVIYNSPVESEVVDYSRRLAKRHPNVVFTYVDHQMDHGPAIDLALSQCTEEYVMLMEDDCFIWNSTPIERAFAKLEGGEVDIVGSKRGSCHGEILEGAKTKWGLSYEGMGDQGPNFWPCLFFSRRSLLESTDRNFSARAWQQGELIAPLGHVVEAPVVYGDTFVNTSLQLRDMVPESRILYIPQYHGHPEDKVHFEMKQYLFDGGAPWVHIGSLSSGLNGVLKLEDGRTLARRKDPTAARDDLPLQNCSTDMERMEWERRVQWWLTVFEHANVQPSDPIYGFYQQYGNAIIRLITGFGLHMKSIRNRQIIYKSLWVL